VRIDEAIAANEGPTFSFEFFPPKTEEGERNLMAALEELSHMEPTFVSVTYGAGGSVEQKHRTVEIVSSIKERYGLEAMPHFTCVGATTQELRETLDRMADAGIENVLALRGDPPEGRRTGRPPKAGSPTRASSWSSCARSTTSRSAPPRSPRPTSTPSRRRATCDSSRRRWTPERGS
jgi:methylenetetrahydrofolate reductase (NADPH)